MAAPWTIMLFASVPPDVKITSVGCAWIAKATCYFLYKQYGIKTLYKSALYIEIEPLKEDLAALRISVLAQLEKNLITKKEAREMLGMTGEV